MNAPPGKSLIRWLGLHRATFDAHGSADTAGSDESPSLDDVARRQLLEDIASFLLDNGMAISDANLAIACSAFSGKNHRIARRIRARQAEGGPITQEWLDGLGEGDDTAARKQQYEELVARLQSGLETFAATTKSARTAQSGFQADLEREVSAISSADATSLALAGLANIAQTMLERTRQVEKEMSRSEQEVVALRKSLAQARREAEIDHLTGLPNRRAFEDVLAREYREAQDAAEPLSLAICDIDHFKRINDAHGHEAGDRVIHAIGQVLACISNEKCHVARHGGEEFVVLFRGLAPPEAQARLDGARTELSGRNFINRRTHQPIGCITFSAGVADVFGHPDCRAALEAADEALFRAKAEGRNRILIASSDAVAGPVDLAGKPGYAARKAARNSAGR